MAHLALSHLNFTYPGQTTPALADVSCRVEAGSFTVLCGPTGCGKSTLLRLFKRELTPLGECTGDVLLDGAPLGTLPEAESARRVGFVMQRPEQQLVTDKVWHEMAFGLENLGLPREEIARRVAEMACYFGIEGWYDRPVDTLSGGQKQLLNLAAVMAMHPEVLILDEPTTQLDPIAAADFIATLHKLNRELGLTILLTEHRLEEVIPLCDHLLVMDAGRLLVDAPPRQALEALSALHREDLLCAMPAAVRLHHLLQAEGPCPLDGREGRAFVQGYGNALRRLPTAPDAQQAPPALEIRDVYFRYDRRGTDVLQGINLTVRQGEICCLLGGNGAGKTTTLHVAAALEKPQSGTVRIFGKPLRNYPGQSLYRECLTLLPQDVQTLFVHDTVAEELSGIPEDIIPPALQPLRQLHPYDLSGGQQQLLGLAKALATRPRLLLLDEPTKGIDAHAKEQLLHLLRGLRESGMALLIVTHDVEFAARLADRCLLFFRGQVVSEGAPTAFFGQSHFYTTAVSRMTRGHYDGAVTVEAAAELCRRNGRKEGAR